MKKLLAILCSVAILTTSLIDSGVIAELVAMAETEKRFLHSFATAADYEASKQYVNNAGTNITLSYDETVGALKAVPATPGKGNHQVRIDPKWGSQTVKVDEYPVIAVKIKFNNVKNPAFGGVFAGTNKAKRPSGSTASVFSDSFLSGSAKTGDWQLLVYDGTNKVWKQGDSSTSATFCGTYEAFICSLTANNQTTTANDIYWIQWAGAFKTVEEAYAYDSEAVSPSPFFYEFEDEATTNNLINSGIVGHNGSNMGRSYSAEEKALKLTPSTSNKNQFIFLAESNNAKVEDYPVMAMKVKFEDPNINFAGIWAGTNRASGSKYGGDALLSGTIETGGWQIIVFDGSKNIFPNQKTKDTYSGTWFGMFCRLAADGITLNQNQGCYVQWVGAFKTAEEAYALDRELVTPSPFVYDFEDEDTTNNLINLGVVSNDGSGVVRSYDAEEKALKLTPSGTNNNKFVIYAPSTDASVKNYPVIAMRVKFNDPKVNFEGIAPGTTRTSGSKYASGYVAKDYTETGAYQLIVFDGTELAKTSTTYTGVWFGLLGLLASNTTTLTAEQCCYIQWAGAFASVEDVYEYEQELQSPFFYSFAEEDTTNSLLNNGLVTTDGSNTVLSYDAEKQALKVSPKDLEKADAGRFVFLADNKITELSDYPVVAIKIKANTITRPFSGIWPGSWNNGSTSKYKAKDICPSYQRTGNWELLVYDGTNSDDPYYTGQWFGLLVRLLGNTTLPTEDDVCWVQWAGAFKTVDEANAYYESTATPEEDDDSEAPFLYNFDDETLTNKLIKGGKVSAGDGKNTLLAYDANESALKVSPKDLNDVDASRVEFRADNVDTEVSEYPVIAIKVKTKNITRSFGGIWPGTYNNGTTSKYKAKDVCPTYNRTGDWELLLYDGTNSTDQYYTGQWYGIIMRLMANNIKPTENDVCWIQWAGVFKTAEEAEEYYLKSCGLDGAEVSVIGDGAGKKDPSGFFYNFTDRETTVGMINSTLVHNGGGSNTVFSYDVTKRALKIQPQDLTKGMAGRFVFEADNATTNTADYPIYALKIKVNTKNNSFAGIWAGTQNSGQKTTYSGPELLDSTTHATTGDWQLIILDNTGNKGFSGQWKSMLFRLFNDTDLAQEGEACWVQWAGAFKSVEAVYEYANMETPAGDEVSRPAFFYDFSNKVDTNIWIGNGKVSGEAGSNTKVSYDDTEKALKLSTLNTTDKQAGRLSILANATAKVEEYPVMAVMIKLNNPNRAFGGLFPGTERKEGGSKFAMPNVLESYQRTGEWQLMVFDGTSYGHEAYVDDWFGFLVRLMGENAVPTEEDYCFIKWAGAFKTAKDAYDFAGMKVPEPYQDTDPSPFFYSFTEEWNTVGYMEDNDVSAAGNTVISYDAKEKALKVSPKNLNDVDACRVEFRADNADTQVKDYPVIAIKVKTKNITRSFGGIWPGTYNNGTTSKYKAKDVCPTYNRTGDWELLLYDGTNSTDQYYIGQWYGILMRLMSNNITPTENDVCWIEWAGVFKTAEEAEQYYLKSCGLDGAEVSVIGDGAGKKDPSGFFYNFTDRETTIGMIRGTNGKHLIHNGGGGNTIFSYDVTKRALKIQPQDLTKGMAGRFVFEANNATTNTADYPIYALKIKVDTADSGFAGIWAGTQNSGQKTTYSGPELLDRTTHATTGDWQLIILDNAGNKGFSGQWKSMLFRLLNDNAKAQNGEACWVQWAGAFKSVEDVYEYANMETPKGDEVNRPAFFYDFSNKVDTNIWIGNGKVSGEGGSNTKLSYDETEKALKLSTLNTTDKQAGRLSIIANATAKVEEYPVMAVMIKLNNPNRMFGGLWPGTERKEGGSKFVMPNVLESYQRTGEWQLMVFDGTNYDHESFVDNWFGFLVRLMGENAVPTEEDYCFIKWAGAFKTAKDAYDFAGMEVPKPVKDTSPSPFFFDFTEEWNTVGYIEDNAVAGDGNSNTSICYDAKEKALKVSPKNYKDKNANVIALYDKGQAINVADYPVFGMKIKTKNVSAVLNSIWAGTNSKYPTKFRVQLPIEQYNASDEWQYMIIDATGYETYDDAFTGTWFGLIMKLMDINVVPTKDDVFYIQWAGVFANADDAYEYAGIENPKKNVPSDPEGKAPTKFFWDLTKNDVIVNHVSTVGDTKTEYDFAANAMKVTVTDTNDDGAVVTTPGRFILGEEIPVKEEIKATEHPFIALRVKLGKETISGGWAHYRTTYSTEKYLAGDMDAADCQVKLLAYEPTSEWQTIVIDCTADPTAAFFFEGNWSALKFDLVSETFAQAGDTVYVKWAGAFKSEEDIANYVKTVEGDGSDKVDNQVEPKPEEKGLPVVAIVIIVVSAVLVIGGGVTAVVLYRKKRKAVK